MKTAVVASLSAFILLHASPVLALDCAKASSSVDKLFCKTPELQKTDEAMGAAYFKLLRETTDPDFHESLIRSQRRWLKERAGGPPRFGLAEDDKTDDRKVLLKMTRDRLKWLQTGEPIRTMEQQRKIAATDSGGPFAGYKTGCNFLPPPYADWSYICWSDVHRQHNARVCSSGTEWASGHTTEYRVVSAVSNGTLQPVATCSTGYDGTNEQCPDPDDDAETKAVSHWNSRPASPDHMPKPDELWKYDPDVASDEFDQPWMNACVSAATYPPPELSRPNSK